MTDENTSRASMPTASSGDDLEKIVAELLRLLTVDQLRCVVDELKSLQQRGHGELILTVKNGEVWYLDAKTGKSLRQPEKQS